MGHGPEHHLEHAEHASHAAHDPLDRKVAMTMAIMAAGLACVTMLSHRGHNETLLLQNKANTKHTQASDDWNFFQAKNIRSHEFQAFLMTDLLRGNSTTPSRRDDAIRQYWTSQVNKYEGKGYWEKFVAHLEGKGERPRGTPDGELAQLMAQAKQRVEEAKKFEKESEHVHHAVNWLDYAHLCLELALVLASVAVLTKQRGFWFTGIAIAVVGAGLTLLGVYGLYLDHH